MKWWLLAVAGCWQGTTPAPVPAHARAQVDAAVPERNPCELSIVVGAQSIDIATPTGACHASTIDLAWLEAELTAIKTEGCTHAEIAADGSGVYQNLVHTMDVAMKVGFVDLGVTDRSTLTLAVPATTHAHCR